jgi:hypothetical protein
MRPVTKPLLFHHVRRHVVERTAKDLDRALEVVKVPVLVRAAHDVEQLA